MTGEWAGEVEPAEKARRMGGAGAGGWSSPMSMPIASPCGSSVSSDVMIRDGRRLLGLFGWFKSSPSSTDGDRLPCFVMVAEPYVDGMLSPAGGRESDESRPLSKCS